MELRTLKSYQAIHFLNIQDPELIPGDILSKIQDPDIIPGNILAAYVASLDTPSKDSSSFA